MSAFIIVLFLLLFFFTSTVVLYIKWQDSEHRYLSALGQYNGYIKKPLLNSTERKLYGILLSLIESKDFYIFPQLHLSSFLKQKEDAKDLKNAFEYLNKLYVDFVIFDHEYNPLLVIELNGNSHNFDFRKARDQFIQKVLRENKINLLVINVNELSENKKITQKILDSI